MIFWGYTKNELRVSFNADAEGFCILDEIRRINDCIIESKQTSFQNAFNIKITDKQYVKQENGFCLKCRENN